MRVIISIICFNIVPSFEKSRNICLEERNLIQIVYNFFNNSFQNLAKTYFKTEQKIGMFYYNLFYALKIVLLNLELILSDDFQHCRKNILRSVIIDTNTVGILCLNLLIVPLCGKK